MLASKMYIKGGILGHRNDRPSKAEVPLRLGTRRWSIEVHTIYTADLVKKGVGSKHVPGNFLRPRLGTQESQDGDKLVQDMSVSMHTILASFCPRK